jgi:hypothetical protein
MHLFDTCKVLIVKTIIGSFIMYRKTCKVLRSAEENLFCHFPNFYEADDKSPLYFYLKGKKSYKNQPALVYTCRIDSLGWGHIVGSDPFKVFEPEYLGSFEAVISATLEYIQYLETRKVLLMKI